MKISRITLTYNGFFKRIRAALKILLFGTASYIEGQGTIEVRET